MLRNKIIVIIRINQHFSDFFRTFALTCNIAL